MKVYRQGRMRRARAHGGGVAAFYLLSSLYWTHWTEHGVLRLVSWTAIAFLFGAVLGYNSPTWLIRTSDAGLEIGYQVTTPEIDALMRDLAFRLPHLPARRLPTG